MTTLQRFQEIFSKDFGCYARGDYRYDTNELARSLVGRYLIYKSVIAKITETEAYRAGDDPASHAFAGRNRRNNSMFAPPGHLYVYLSYGVHFCINVVGGQDEVASGILIRSVGGLDFEQSIVQKMESSGFRPNRTGVTGPGRVGRCVSAQLNDDGLDLCDDESGVFVAFARGEKPPKIASYPRIGISKAVDFNWRYIECDSTSHSLVKK